MDLSSNQHENRNNERKKLSRKNLVLLSLYAISLIYVLFLLSQQLITWLLIKVIYECMYRNFEVDTK
jgi:uncharacterized membrane protein